MVIFSTSQVLTQCFPTWGPFHKSFCASVFKPAGLRSMLGVKSNPAKGKILKFVHAIKFWRGAVSTLSWNLLWNGPQGSLEILKGGHQIFKNIYVAFVLPIISNKLTWNCYSLRRLLKMVSEQFWSFRGSAKFVVSEGILRAKKWRNIVLTCYFLIS